jgi:hypothetical protein
MDKSSTLILWLWSQKNPPKCRCSPTKLHNFTWNTSNLAPSCHWYYLSLTVHIPATRAPFNCTRVPGRWHHWQGIAVYSTLSNFGSSFMPPMPRVKVDVSFLSLINLIPLLMPLQTWPDNHCYTTNFTLKITNNRLLGWFSEMFLQFDCKNVGAGKKWLKHISYTGLINILPDKTPTKPTAFLHCSPIHFTYN